MRRTSLDTDRVARIGSVEFVHGVSRARTAFRLSIAATACVVFSVGIPQFGVSPTAAGQVVSAAAQGQLVDLGGRVIDSSTIAGIFGATVVIKTLDGTSRKVVETDVTGNFSVSHMPAGVYQITATHADHSPGGYGQLWPGAPFRPLRILPSARTQDVTIRLWSSAAIDGTVTTETGESLADTNVVLISSTSIASPRTPPILLTATTNSQGAYQFTGVPPGKYVLGTPQSYRTICQPSQTQQPCALTGREHSLKPVIRKSGAPRVYESVFYPNASQLSEAEVLWLHPGQSARGMDLIVPLVDTAEIRGAIDSIKGPLPHVGVRIGRPGNMGLETLDLAAALATTDEHGRFVALGVPSGQQTLVAEYRTAKVQGPTITNTPYGLVRSGSVTVMPLSDETPLLLAISAFLLGNENITDWNLTLVQAPSLKGVVRFEGASKFPDSSTLTARSAIVRATDRSFPSARATLDSAGRFAFPSLAPGAYSLSLDNIPGWSVHSIRVHGRPIGDEAVDLRYQSVEDVEIDMTDHVASLDGVVVRKDGQNDPNLAVFFFPSTALSRNENISAEDARFVSVSESGQFTLRPLKSGDYFLIAISDGWCDLDWREREILQVLARQATRIRVVDGQTLTVTLTSVTSNALTQLFSSLR